MATDTAQVAGTRRLHYQQVTYIRFPVTYSDAGIASAYQTAYSLPANSIIIGTDVVISTTFNAQTTNVLTVGTNGTTATNIISAGDVDETTAGLTQNKAPTATALGVISTDSPIWVKYTQTGTAGTQGAAVVVIKYVML